jgi:hypothetical protein
MINSEMQRAAVDHLSLNFSLEILATPQGKRFFFTEKTEMRICGSTLRRGLFIFRARYVYIAIYLPRVLCV